MVESAADLRGRTFETNRGNHGDNDVHLTATPTWVEIASSNLAKEVVRSH